MGSCCSASNVQPPQQTTPNVRNSSLPPMRKARGSPGSRPGVEMRPKVNKEDFIVSGKSGELIVREPGKVRGLQFVIADCRNCDIFLVDRVGTLTVDACAGCRIFVGPCEGSVFVRDCQDCQVVCLAQQFRTRDCKRCDIRLFCQTEPVIESSKNLRFGCVDMSYFGMAAHLERTGLDVWNNRWDEVHDFTPGGAQNWSLLPSSITARSMLSGLTQKLASTLSVQVASSQLCVPVTVGLSAARGECCFVCLLGQGSSARARAIMAAVAPGATLVRTRSIALLNSQASVLFSDTRMRQLAKSAPCLALEFGGEAAIAAVQGAVAGIDVAAGGIYVAPDADTARKQATEFFEAWKPAV